MAGRAKVAQLFSLAILVSLALSQAGLGDEVEIKDGRLFSGTIQSGIPDSLSLDDRGVIITVSKDRIKQIIKEAEGLKVETTTDVAFTGKPVSELPIRLVIRTATGVIEVKQEDVVRISFPRKTIPIRAQPQEIELKDGRRFEGKITTGIPDPLSINVAGTIWHIPRDQIREIRYEEEIIIETVENEVLKGSIITALPEKIGFQTSYGTVEVKTLDLARILFRKAILPTAPHIPSFTLAGGLSFWMPLTEFNIPLGVLVYNGSIKFPLTPNFWIGVEAGYCSISISDYQFSFVLAQGKGLLYLLTNRIRPYIAGGIGLTILTFSSPMDRSSAQLRICSLSLGTDIVLTDGLSVYLQAELPFLPCPPTSSGSLPLFVIGGGLSYSF